MIGLFAHRDARRYLAGQALSLLGDSALWLSCGIWVKTLTGSSAAAGLTFLFFGLPALVAPLGGLLVDRVSRRPLLVAANLGGVAVIAPLLLVRGAGDVWLIYAVMIGYGALNVLIGPAQSALLSSVLPAELRPAANATLRTVQESLQIIAPLAGAGLFALVGPRAVVAADMLTFLGAALLTATLTARGDVQPRAAAAGFAAEVAAGFRFVLRHRMLRGLALGTAVATLVVGFGDSANYAVVDALHRSPDFLGVLQTISGAGAIAGGLTASALIRRWGEGPVAAAGAAAFGLGILLLAGPGLTFAVLGKAVCGVGLPWVAIAVLSAFQRLTPDHLQGRAFTALEMLTTTPQTASIGVGAALIAAFDFRWVLAAEGLVLLAAAVTLLSATRAASVQVGGRVQAAAVQHPG